MPTPVTGSPTGVAAPAVLPGPDTFVIVDEPIAGEGATAASVNQAFTALANEQAWLKDPRAATPAAPAGLDPAFVQPTLKAKNVRLQRRDFTDHRGFSNMARITRWHEDWRNVVGNVGPGSAADVAWFNQWLYSITPGSGTPNVFTMDGGKWPAGPGTPPYVGGTLVLDTGAVPGPSACEMMVQAATQASCLITEDSDIVFQTEIVLAGGESVWGLLGGTAYTDPTGSFPSTTPIAAAIISGRPTATHVELYTCPPGGSPTLTSLGAAGDASTRWRLEVQGTNSADDSNARVIVYGDGDITKPLANVAVDFAPVNPADRMFYRPFFRTRSTSGRQIGRWGATDLAFARWPGDIAY